MAKAFEQSWNGCIEGLVITRYGHSVKTNQIEIVEASHPIPDSRGFMATKRILEMVSSLNSDDLVIALISGGGSSLLTLPAEGLSLKDKQEINVELLKSGAPIKAINCIRSHISLIKGGRLAQAAYPARVVSLIISDVPGDDPTIIASGPTVPDPTTFSNALELLNRYRIPVSEKIMDHLKAGLNESPKPGDPYLLKSQINVLASPGLALKEAAKIAHESGYKTILLGDAIEGEARIIADEHAQIALNSEPGTVILSGGELTVALKGDGKGGPNTEYALALALSLNGARNIYALACDTDGIDGSENNAGAFIGPDTIERAKTAGKDPIFALKNNDSYTFFSGIGDLMVTGPTHTNVNDFRAILVEH
jgi:hydroxypyruvate reductase